MHRRHDAALGQNTMGLRTCPCSRSRITRIMPAYSFNVTTTFGTPFPDSCKSANSTSMNTLDAFLTLTPTVTGRFVLGSHCVSIEYPKHALMSSTERRSSVTPSTSIISAASCSGASGRATGIDTGSMMYVATAG